MPKFKVMRFEGGDTAPRPLEIFETFEEAQAFVAEQEGFYFEGQHYIEAIRDD